MAPPPPLCQTCSVGDSTITHRGNAYGVGQGEDHYGVWDLRAGGDPVARYEMTPEGWIQAWSRYQELERRFGTPRWRAAGVGWILLHLLIALAIWFLVTSVTLVAVGERPESIIHPGVVGAFVGLIPGVTGWFLFVYLPRSLGIRWLALLTGYALQVGLIIVTSLPWETF